MKKILSLVLGLLWALPVWGACQNLYNESAVTDGYFYNADFEWTENASTYTTDFMGVAQGTYVLSVNKKANLSSPVNVRVNLFDANKVIKSQLVFSIDNGTTDLDIEISIPVDVSYVRASSNPTFVTFESFLPINCVNSCRNLFDKDTADANRIYGFFQQTGTSWTWAQNGFSVRIPCKPNTTYTARYNGNDTQVVLGFGSTNNDDVPPSGTSVSVTQGIRQNNPTINTPITLTTGPNDKWLIVAYNVAEPQHSDMANNLQIEEGDTATAYVPYCKKIKIATTKYNESAFSPLNTALQNAISVVDTVVSNTITQAGRIATLQAQKQTRPNDIADDSEKCPAGIKCLLVEDANGTPHWYAIQESYLPLGYTPLKYINKPSGAYTDSGIKFTSENVTIEITGSSSSMVDGMFGAQDGSNNHSALLIYANHLYAGENGFANPTIFDSDLHKIIIEANNKNITLTNYAGEVVNLSYTQSIQSRNGWYIGGMRSNDRVLTNSIGKVGIIKIWDNGNLVFHGIPAKYGEEIGFYDIVQNRFLTSMSEQKFTAGPVAE